jgi:hypothetical protein
MWTIGTIIMVDYQNDIKVDAADPTSERFTKVTLSLGPTGDITLVSGRSKLAEQLLRAIINDKTVSKGISLNYSALTPRYLNTLITLILRNFKNAQIYQTDQSDPRCLGFSLYRFDNYVTTANFIKVSSNPIEWKFTDTGLSNGFTYTYAIKKDYGTVESAFLEKVQVVPTQFQDNQNPVIGDNIVALPGNKAVTIYVNYNRYFKASELLDSIQDIAVTQDQQEPRRFSVDITVEDLNNNKVSLSTSRMPITKG